MPEREILSRFRTYVALNYGCVVSQTHVDNFLEYLEEEKELEKELKKELETRKTYCACGGEMELTDCGMSCNVCG